MAPAPAATALAAMEMMVRETQVRAGAVPRHWHGVAIARDTSLIGADSYVLRTRSGLGFFYAKGQGTVAEHEAGADLREESLWLNGSVYAAIACINGLMPIHASAVAHQGQVYAFTGPSGSGKSTLIAALAARGFAMFCDDTLVLDLADPRQVTCLPGHKRLKLTRQALALTHATAEEPVGAETGKFYACAASAPVTAPLPLAELIFLEHQPAAAITPISGGERIARLDDGHYTSAMFVSAQQLARGEIFALRARLARQIAMLRFARPRDPVRFAESVALAARHIASAGQPSLRESSAA